jgi:outer membrane protein OmpA-like peptidoglycan-associated protein
MIRKCLAFFLLFSTFSFAQEQEIKILNTNINTSAAEFGATYVNPNTVIYASSKKTENEKLLSKDRRERNQQLFLELYYGVISTSGDIIESGKVSPNNETQIFESDITFTPNAQTCYFTLNNFYNNVESVKDSAKWKTLQLMKASINSSFELSNVTHLPFNSKDYSVRYPAVSSDGKQLFFVSNMPGGFGGNDIYVVDILPNNTFSEPKNLGANINTKDDEIFPFSDENNTLYFASYGHKGLGGFDVYKSEFVDGNYQTAENLPDPINSKYDDFNYIINNANNTGYFSSNRKGSKGDVDIYAFKIYDKDCIQTISGNLENETDHQLISEASVSLFINNELIETQKIQNNSNYSFNVPCNTSYKLIVEKEDYQPFEIEAITTTESVFTKNIALKPVECYRTISGLVFNEKSSKQLSQVNVSLFENGTLKETQLTQVGSKFSFILNCKDTYKIVAQKEGFLNTEVDLVTKNKPYYLEDQNLYLTPLICEQTITGLVVNENNQPMTNVKISLFINDVLSDLQLTNTTNSFTFNVDCETSYKIMAEKEGYLPAETKLLTNNKPNFSNTVNLTLLPDVCNTVIAGTILDKETKKPLPEALVAFYKQDLLISNPTLNAQANFNFDAECNTQYKVVTSLIGYKNSIVYINTSSIDKEKLTKDILLEAVEEFISKDEETLIKTDVIYFDLDSYEIRPDAAIEINKVINILKKYPNLKVEIASHTDSRAPDNYNLNLSEQRAQATMNYIILGGIDPSRLTAKGYGETQLLNKCKNGVVCTDAEHEKNRRTEFVIIE